MKKVIALYSFPQECGDDSLRFISCEDGQVIEDINLTPQRETEEEIVHRELLSETAIFYDRCVKQRFNVGDIEDNIDRIYGMCSDKQCTKRLKGEFWDKYRDEDLTIINVEDLGESPEGILEIDPLHRAVHIWRYTVALVNSTVEYVYHPEWDTVYLEIKEKYGIECPEKERYDREKLANKIAEALDYKLLNILYS